MTIGLVRSMHAVGESPLQALALFSLRATDWASYRLGRIGRLAKAVNVGCWLGALRDDQLARLNLAYYAGSTTFGDTPYADDDFNAGGFTTRELAAVQRHFAPQGTVLVGGAGGGREVLALSRLGFQVDGFECNPTLAEYGNAFLARHGCPARIELAAPDTCPPGPTRYDAALIGWGVYIHIIPRRRREAFLRDVRARLTGNGALLVGFCRRDDGSRYFRIVARLANGIRRVAGRPPVERGDKLEPTFEHHFTVAEMVEELAAAGFDTHFVDDAHAGRALVVGVPSPSTAGNA